MVIVTPSDDMLMQGRRTSASLMVANLTAPDGEGSGVGGSKGLYSLFWQLRGDMCGVRTDFRCQFYAQLKLKGREPRTLDPQPYCLDMQNVCAC